MGKKKSRRWTFALLVLTILLALAPQSGLSAKAAAKLSKKTLLLVQGQKYELKVSGAKGKKVTWKSANPKVATVSKGKIWAKKRGETKITAKVGTKTLTCKLRVSEKPVVYATTTVTGKKEDYVTALVIQIQGKRSAKLTKEVKLKTPGKGQQMLSLLDEKKTLASQEGKVYFKKSLTVRPYTGKQDEIGTAFYARKDYKPFVVTSKSQVVLYFRYDGVDFKTVVLDMTSQKKPKACKLTRLTGY